MAAPRTIDSLHRSLHRLSVVLVSLTIGLTAAVPAGAECPRVEASEEDFPFLAGRYELVGRLPDSDVTYAGAVELAQVDGAFVVTRTVAGESVEGNAWLQNCGGAEERLSVRFRYRIANRELNQVCEIAVDSDNATRLTCKTGWGERSSNDRLGVEALFQVIE